MRNLPESGNRFLNWFKPGRPVHFSIPIECLVAAINNAVTFSRGGLGYLGRPLPVSMNSFAFKITRMCLPDRCFLICFSDRLYSAMIFISFLHFSSQENYNTEEMSNVREHLLPSDHLPVCHPTLLAGNRISHLCCAGCNICKHYLHCTHIS